MINISNHPLIQDKMTILRDKNTKSAVFRQVLEEISTLLFYEATTELTTQSIDIETPVAPLTATKLSNDKIILVPILRAGLGMVESCSTLLPKASIWHLGLKRNEQTLEPEFYYQNFGDGSQVAHAFVLDPMLATGGSASTCLERLKKQNIKKMSLISIIAAPEGIEKINQDHPDVKIFSAAMDEKLNEHGYIVPGLGDAGDRLFNT